MKLVEVNPSVFKLLTDNQGSIDAVAGNGSALK